jgi:hypothetical protein
MLVISKLDSLQVNSAQTRVQRYKKIIQGIIKISLLKTVKKAKTGNSLFDVLDILWRLWH